MSFTKRAERNTFTEQDAKNNGDAETTFFDEIEIFEKFIEEGENVEDIRRQKINKLADTLKRAIKLTASLKDSQHPDNRRQTLINKISALEKEMHAIQEKIIVHRKELNEL